MGEIGCALPRKWSTWLKSSLHNGEFKNSVHWNALSQVNGFSFNKCKVNEGPRFVRNATTIEKEPPCHPKKYSTSGSRPPFFDSRQTLRNFLIKAFSTLRPVTVHWCINVKPFWLYRRKWSTGVPSRQTAAVTVIYLELLVLAKEKKKKSKPS